MAEFSLNLLCKGQKHLLAQTLDTLKTQKGAFEVLVLDGEGGGHLNELMTQYPELRLKMAELPGKSAAEMMNRGLELSSGKYIQFIEPGDRYISQYGLEFLSTWIAQHGEPDVIYTPSLVQGEIVPSEWVASRSPWLLRSTILSSGGFDRHLQQRPIFDFLCKLMQNKKTHALFCPRILMTPFPNTYGPGYLRETWKI